MLIMSIDYRVHVCTCLSDRLLLCFLFKYSCVIDKSVINITIATIRLFHVVPSFVYVKLACPSGSQWFPICCVIT